MAGSMRAEHSFRQTHCPMCNPWNGPALSSRQLATIPPRTGLDWNRGTVISREDFASGACARNAPGAAESGISETKG